MLIIIQTNRNRDGRWNNIQLKSEVNDMSASLGIGGASGILASLTGSGLIPKEYKQLASGSSYEFVGGALQ